MTAKSKLGKKAAELLKPKPKRKYDVTETKPGDKPWWVKEGLGKKPKPKTKKQYREIDLDQYNKQRHYFHTNNGAAKFVI